MGARGLLKMIFALLAVIFGGMVVVGDGPVPLAQGSDDGGSPAAALLAEAMDAISVDPEAEAEPVMASLTTTDDAVDPVAESVAQIVAQASTDPANAPLTAPALQNVDGVVIVAAAGTAPEVTPIPVTAVTTGSETNSVEIAAAAPKLYTVTGRRVNVRAGPSTGNAVIGKVQRGDAVELVEFMDNGWARIRLPNSEDLGYMSGDFLKAVAGG